MLGYQPNDDWSGASVPTDERQGSSPFAIGMIAIAVFTLFDGLVWVFNGGGIISILGALAAVHANRASIDVDQNGLSVATAILLCVLLIGLCRLFGIETLSRRQSGLCLLALVAVLLVFDLGPENGLIARYMVAHEYRHCASQDRTIGSGKGQVWFNNYVRSSIDCPSQR